MVEDSTYAVYIYSNDREGEASEVAENLKRFLAASAPPLRAASSRKWFIDFR